MNTKFTPEYVLKMLQEIKELSDQDNFYVYPFFKKYPSFYGFKKILVNKGIISKDVKKPKWLSIIPNIIDPKPKATIFEFEPIAGGVPSWDELYAAASSTATGQRILREVRMDLMLADAQYGDDVGVALSRRRGSYFLSMIYGLAKSYDGPWSDRGARGRRRPHAQRRQSAALRDHRYTFT
jgi:hypothetical protein